MALYKRKQLIELLGVTHAHISMYIKRGKIIEKRGYIDSENPYNADFIRQYLEKNKQESAPIEQKIAETPQQIPVVRKNSYTKYELETEKKKLEIEVQQRQSKLLQIKIDKQMGMSIPTELVLNLFSQHTKSISSAFKTEAENLFLKLSVKYRLTSQDTVNMRNDLIGMTNAAIDRSISETKKAVKNIVAEYSEKRGQGDRK